MNDQVYEKTAEDNSQVNEVAKRFCPNCGNALEANAAFCGECGTNLNAEDIPASPVAPGEPVKKEKKAAKFFKTHKKKLIVIAAIALAAILLIVSSYGIFCGIAKKKVVGTWERESIYLRAYSGNVTTVCVISDDGTWAEAGVRDSDSKIVYINSGTWKMKGRNVEKKTTGKPGTVSLKYRLNGTMENGGNTYTKIKK